MENLNYKHRHILLAGDKKLVVSLSVCLLRAGHQVTILNPSTVNLLTPIDTHLSDLKNEGEVVSTKALEIVKVLDKPGRYDMAICITNEVVADKVSLLNQLENYLDEDAIIAINTESIALSTLQKQVKYPERLIGANWVEPAHTTYFLEIITNQLTNKHLVADFCDTARQHWNKDPYVLSADAGIRAKMMCALVREAFYLIENNYVTVEDIDRACRNDAGYYMPFAGNFRYMDLMGTYMYGVVMQDLNPELSKMTHVPDFCRELLNNGYKGMANGHGFYEYEPGEVEMWDATFRKFSYQIQQIIQKYPFNYLRDSTVLKSEMPL